MKEEAPNVAMLWSPSESPLSVIESYYPGDKYVDWVGISIYSKKFMNGDVTKNNEKKNSLEALDFIYNLYADKKPIMISEYAASHQVTSQKLDSTLFAPTKMSMFYQGVKLKYPKVKSINWFSYNTYLHDIGPEKQVSNYSLFENSEVNKRYKELIQDDYFLSNVLNGPFVNTQMYSPKVFVEYKKEPVKSNLTFNNWVKMYGPYIQKVVYKLNGLEIKSSMNYPFDLTVKQSELKGGLNSFETIAYDSKGVREFVNKKLFLCRFIKVSTLK